MHYIVSFLQHELSRVGFLVARSTVCSSSELAIKSVGREPWGLGLVSLEPNVFVIAQGPNRKNSASGATPSPDHGRDAPAYKT
jgi:hypothetical protein